jgi:hypothetical protein
VRRNFIYSSQQNMKNKNLSLKCMLMAVAVGFVSMWFCSATTNFHFNIEAVKAIKESLQDDIMQIHFTDNWNDFGGFFYFSNGLGNESEWESSENIYYACVATWTDGNEIKKCVLTGSECKEELFTGDGTIVWDPTFYDNPTYFDTGCSESLTNDPEIDKYQYEVSMNGSEYTCSRQVKWYYYNAERWERLWPLDGDTWSDRVTTTWWFYTMCKKRWYIDALKRCLNGAQKAWGAKNYYDCKEQARKDYATDGDGYYGSIKHLYSWQEMELIAWVKYNPNTKFTSIDDWAGFSPTFIRFGNKYPLWFIYDNNGGVWFVWCRIDGNDPIKNIIRKYNSYSINTPNPLDSLFKDEGDSGLEYNWGDDVEVNCTGLSWDSLIWVVIEWIVWMWEVSNTANFDVIWNQKDDKMQYFSSANINNNTIINYARKKAELLCRWKWQKNVWSPKANESVICVDANNGTITWNLSKLNGKTLIVKNWNVVVEPFEYGNSKDYYDIFIDSWNLIINETDDTKKFVIKNNGFISNNTPSDFKMHVLAGWFKNDGESIGNYIECFSNNEECTVNWWIDDWKDFDFNEDGKVDDSDIELLNLCNDCTVWDDAAVASIIKWNFIVNWNILWPDTSDKKLKNKYFIYWKLSSRDSFQSLQDTFTWRCNNWYTTDGSYCLPTNKEKWYNNPYEDAFLVVIDQNYENSPFFSAS